MRWREWLGFVVAGVAVFLVGMAIHWAADADRSPQQDFGCDPCYPIALVAKQLIPKGTPGSLIVSQEMYVQSAVKEYEGHLIFWPADLSGRVAAVDIVPGQPLTRTDFAASDASASP